MTSPKQFHSGRKGTARRSSNRRGRHDSLGVREHGNHPSRERWRARDTIHIDPMANKPRK